MTHTMTTQDDDYADIAGGVLPDGPLNLAPPLEQAARHLAGAGEVWDEDTAAGHPRIADELEASARTAALVSIAGDLRGIREALTKPTEKDGPVVEVLTEWGVRYRSGGFSAFSSFTEASTEVAHTDGAVLVSRRISRTSWVTQ